MYLNRENIETILQAKQVAEANGYAFAQVNSRRNGRFLDVCRVYEKAADKGRPHLAICQMRAPKDFHSFTLIMLCMAAVAEEAAIDLHAPAPAV